MKTVKFINVYDNPHDKINRIDEKIAGEKIYG